MDDLSHTLANAGAVRARWDARRDRDDARDATLATRALPGDRVANTTYLANTIRAVDSHNKRWEVRRDWAGRARELSRADAVVIYGVEQHAGMT